jgi:hypothetical protein
MNSKPILDIFTSTIKQAMMNIYFLGHNSSEIFNKRLYALLLPSKTINTRPKKEMSRSFELLTQKINSIKNLTWPHI